ncbi:MAG: excinuclease ABC subunit UvrA [Eubacteriales bacterium]|nr:excinuclease ABC subunit UvrA [Candidatus Colimorpha enterica]
MSLSSIIVKGARVHNLKNIDVTVPRDRFVVFTGLSGSGKSSLAFDTIYAEGHRRFVESLSSYARMFLGQLDKPDVDLIEGLSPAISIDQKTTSKNPRSTVGTVTEIYDYLRLMYARIGIPHCPVCGKEIRQQSIDQIIDDICSLPAGTKFMILAPVVSGKKGMHEKVFEDAKKNGYVRVRVDGEMYDVNDIPELEKNKKHTVDIVVDRLVMKEGIRGRLTDSAETALNLAKGNLHIVTVGDTPEEYRYSQNYACEEHGFSMGELSPRMFSFNNPYGACERCAGIGELRTVSFDLICPDRSLSLADGAVAVNGFKSLDDSTWTAPLYEAVGERHGFTLDMPIKDYSKAALDALLNGTGDEIYEIDRSFDGRHAHQRVKFEGILSIIEQRYSMSQNEYYEQFFEFIPCPKCKGRRLRDEVLAVTVGGLSVDALCSLSIDSALDFVNALKLTKTEEAIARDIVKELRSRLGFLKNVGLGYLTLSRKAGTLSGGESQRIRLATQIGSSLMGVLYILDEPSIGLHQRDNHRLIEALKALRDIGNSLIVVEHDEETMMEADYIVDIGPGAGINGGQVVAVGTPQEIIDNPASITGDYLSGRRKIAVPEKRREGSGKFLQIIGARQNNLKNIDVAIPLGMLVCVTGVSGSGKSSLINSILYPVLAKQLNRAVTHPGKHDRIEGIDNLDKVIAIDQSPIGRTPRSNPATYTGLFNDIRELFASTNDAKIRGYKAGRFSFNIKGGRCEACEGDGVKCIEMHFLPDVYVTCDVCKGKRYNRDTLEVKYKGKNIFDVLDMTVDEGLAFFENIPKISRRLKTLADVGLGYIKIGQSSTTLSGGEAQRVKLATELSKHSTGRTAYILDEPTTGLHSADVDRLISILQRLTDQGNTVIVIEHNLDLIKTADYIIDMGPEGGDMGGTVIACGTPEQVAEVKGSYTGYYLKNILAR